MTAPPHDLTKPLVHSVSVRNFKCLRNVNVELAPLTVLIGKNDTGKSSFLEALHCLAQAATGGSPGIADYRTIGETAQELSTVTTGGEVCIQFDARGQQMTRGRVSELHSVQRPYRLDSSQLRRPAMVGVLGENPLPYNGESLAAALDRLPLSRMIKLQEEIRSRIPTVRELLLRSPNHGKKGVFFELQSGAEISAQQMSDGAMLILAFLLIVHDEHAPRLIMVEEPENGIHPKQLEYVLKALHSLTQREESIQVVLSTHSPYVLDLVPKESVRVFTREKQGEVSVTNFADISEVRSMLSSGFTLGEAWFNSDEDELTLGTGTG